MICFGFTRITTQFCYESVRVYSNYFIISWVKRSSKIISSDLNASNTAAVAIPDYQCKHVLLSLPTYLLNDKNCVDDRIQVSDTIIDHPWNKFSFEELWVLKTYQRNSKLSLIFDFRKLQNLFWEPYKQTNIR